MDLNATLQYLGFSFSDYEIFDDLTGTGPVIVEWNSGSDQPTQTELDTAWATVQTNNAADIIPNAKVVAVRLIDTVAGSIRMNTVSDIVGQSDIYREKYDQSVDYAALSYPADYSAYPFITAEVNATGLTAEQAADGIIAARSAWMDNMSAIEEERRKGKVNVDAATTEAEITTAKDAAITALQLI